MCIGQTSQIRYFSVLPLCGACFSLSRVLVLCRKPSFCRFFVGVLVSFDINFYLVSLSGVVHMSLGYPCLSPFHSLFLVFSLVLFLVVLRAFLSSRVLHLVVAFYFLLFCYVLIAVRVRSAPEASFEKICC